MKIIILISLAGVVGTLARFSMVKGMSALFPYFPWGTLLVNVIGAFLAGFCFVLCGYICQFRKEAPALLLRLTFLMLYTPTDCARNHLLKDRCLTCCFSQE
jgi:fluoride ion exporter CrcB/FEX